MEDSKALTQDERERLRVEEKRSSLLILELREGRHVAF